MSQTKVLLPKVPSKELQEQGKHALHAFSAISVGLWDL